MTQTTVLQTQNQIISNKDTSKLLLGFNQFREENLSASGADVTITPGLVLARVIATNNIKPVNIAIVDGSEYIIGVAITEQVILDGDNKDIMFVAKGEIAEELISVPTGDLESPYGPTGNQKTVRDILEGIGLSIKTGVELTKYDNF